MKDDKIITRRSSWKSCAAIRKARSSRRHFLGVTGLGLATAVLGPAVPGLRPRKAYAALSGTVNLTTWPNYHDQENLDAFTKKTGVTDQDERLRLERGDAGQAAGRPHRLGRLRADQLHDLDLQGASISSSRSISSCCRTTIPPPRTSASPRKARSTAPSMPCRRTGAPPATSSTPRT